MTCEGCDCFIGSNKVCLANVYSEYEGHECPCKGCLIKMMCSESCPDFFDYMHLWTIKIKSRNTQWK